MSDHAFTVILVSIVIGGILVFFTGMIHIDSRNRLARQAAEVDMVRLACAEQTSERQTTACAVAVARFQSH